MKYSAWWSLPRRETFFFIITRPLLVKLILKKESRLLSVSNYFENMENEFLKRICLIMGEQQIIKIKGMIEDMASSKILNKNFITYVKKAKADKELNQFAKVNMEFTLITKAKWPAEVLEYDVCQPPEDLELLSKKFDEFYKNRGGGATKKIMWLFGEGYVEVSSKFGSKKYILMISVAQYAVLKLLESAPNNSLSVGDLKAQVKFDKKYKMPILAPLISKKLLRRSKDRKAKLTDDELLSLNLKFKYKTKKLNLIKKAGLKNRDKKTDNVSLNSLYLETNR